MIELKERTYRINECASFQRSREKHGDLSNMSFGFPINAGGLRFQGPEGLYQAMKYPDNPRAQRNIAGQRSGMDAKRTAYEYPNPRPDWDEVRITAMAATLAMKLTSHPERFGKALKATGNLPIVELSTRDSFWGAKPKGAELVGVNVLGKLLTELRKTLAEQDGNAEAAAEAFLKDVNTSRLSINGQLLGTNTRAGTVAEQMSMPGMALNHTSTTR